MTDIGGLLTAATGGGVFGLLGNLANRGFSIWETREKRKDAQMAYQQEEKRWANEKDLLRIQMEQKQEAHEQDLETAAVSGSWQGLTESLHAEAAVQPSYRWVNAVRSLVRPFLTLESQIAAGVIYLAAKGPAQAELQQAAAETILFIATASALWWFGARAEHKPRARG